MTTSGASDDVSRQDLASRLRLVGPDAREIVRGSRHEFLFSFFIHHHLQWALASDHGFLN